MATSTITLVGPTDDSGSYAAPAGDGTAFNNAWVQSTLLPAIAATWASAGFTVAGGMIWEGTGVNAINDTTNGNMTTGLTINQGTADNEILCLKSSDVAHGITDLAETDSYSIFTKASATDGGLNLFGFSEATQALILRGYGVTDDTTKSTAGRGYVNILAGKKSGTSAVAPGANANMVTVFDAAGTTRFILDADGDSHQDVGTAWTNFDDHEDAELLTAFSAGVSRKGDPLRLAFGGLLKKHKATLEQARIVTFNRDGHHFVNWSRLNMLKVGAIRQNAAAIRALAGQLNRVERRLLALETA